MCYFCTSYIYSIDTLQRQLGFPLYVVVSVWFVTVSWVRKNSSMKKVIPRMYGSYFQAQVVEKECWFLVGVMRSFEHLSFDRTYDKVTSTFEFFVPSFHEKTFLEIMEYFKQTGVVTSYTKLPNRLEDPTAEI